MKLQHFHPGIAVYVSYVCRDIGYGPEADADYMTFVGGPDETGKWEFRRSEGTRIYLFEDEIVEFLPDDGPRAADEPACERCGEFWPGHDPDCAGQLNAADPQPQSFGEFDGAGSILAAFKEAAAMQEP